MLQRCPICRTRLWSEVLFYSSKLRCPRCGAEFKATVPWMHTRVLIAVLAGMVFVVAGLLIPSKLTMFFIVLVVLLALWLLPYIVRFELIGPELRASEGSLESKDWGKALEGEPFPEDKPDEERKYFFSKVVWVFLFSGLVFLLISSFDWGFLIGAI